MLKNRKIWLSSRIILLNGLVKSRNTYGCHAWRPQAYELSKLTTYNHFLRYNLFKRVNPVTIDVQIDKGN